MPQLWPKTYTLIQLAWRMACLSLRLSWGIDGIVFFFVMKTCSKWCICKSIPPMWDVSYLTYWYPVKALPYTQERGMLRSALNIDTILASWDIYLQYLSNGVCHVREFKSLW